MPKEIDLGIVQLNLYFFFTLLAIFVGACVAVSRQDKTNYPWHWSFEGMSFVILAGIAGTGLFWRLLQVAEQLLTGSITRFGSRVFTVFGGILFGTLAGLAYCRWRGVSAGEAFDRGIPGMPLGQGIGRIGCLFGGCCFGRPTDSWLGMYLPGQAGVWADRYPTQLLSTLADFSIFGLLIVIDRRLGGVNGAYSRGWFPGYLTLLYGFLYFLKRFMMEFVRAERPLVWKSFTCAHAASAAGLLVVTFLWVICRRRYKKS